MLKPAEAITKGVTVAGEKQKILDLAPTVKVTRVDITVQEDGTILADLHFISVPTAEATAAGMLPASWVEENATVPQGQFNALINACSGANQKDRPQAYKP